ncbi:hypothetical protein K488DRAFT_87153 [Vararia minispora EC-137]|uniref:Uncharacterized protein n=1 Tax=Vararia minispora EC-137 TaxID=1314806 RepID=A0ACB8QH79_9AGAM|nr:hypothetical protein K488DRAFT_87153 [Vararia minispora EC-137]
MSILAVIADVGLQMTRFSEHYGCTRHRNTCDHPLQYTRPGRIVLPKATNEPPPAVSALAQYKVLFTDLVIALPRPSPRPPASLQLIVHTSHVDCLEHVICIVPSAVEIYFYPQVHLSQLVTTTRFVLVFVNVKISDIAGNLRAAADPAGLRKIVQVAVDANPPLMQSPGL